ncbi:flagellar hook-associated protein 2 [bacterium BMS3Bbin06]|nr:flagellar hook-associated protein 2 [bacterium BMS3Abin08]GBE33888.1 flagellar hook-associated protein 2 [bacterium BMS3Bbin06]
MSVISGIGLTSGIDYNKLISSLIELQRQPVYRLQSRQSDYNNKISAYSTLSSKLSSFQSAADNLRNTANFYAKTASVSNSTVLDAATSNSASSGIYTIDPHSVAGKIQLAAVDRRTGTTSFTSTTDVVNNTGASQTFEYTYAGTTSTLTIADQTTLEGLRDAINNDTGNPGVTATVINVGTSDYRLVLTGRNTGSSNTVAVTANTTITGFSDSDFTASTAQDAKFRIGGVDITKSSNTVSDVIPGVTLTLKAESASAVTVTVNNDTDTIRQHIEDFVNAYNEVVDNISNNSQYDTKTHTGGPLNGESTARAIKSRLSNIVTSRVAGLPQDLRTLAQIGISTDYHTGHLSIDSATLNDKLTTRLDDVANLFTDSTSGIGNKVYDYTDSVTNSIDGTVTIRTKGLQSNVTGIADDITDLEARLTLVEEDLRKRFASLEAMLTGMSSQSAFLSNLTSRMT